MIKTTIDLIKFLPFDEEYKKELIGSYDALSDEKKFKIGRMLWAAYDVLFQMKLKVNMAIALEEAEEDREKLDENLYKRVRDLTENEMNQVSAEDIKALDLDLAREKLAAMIASDK